MGPFRTLQLPHASDEGAGTYWRQLEQRWAGSGETSTYARAVRAVLSSGPSALWSPQDAGAPRLHAPARARAAAVGRTTSTLLRGIRDEFGTFSTFRKRGSFRCRES